MHVHVPACACLRVRSCLSACARVCVPECVPACACVRMRVLQPGEMLYIPPRWWHYVKSLSVSFSVSFWWK